jgi:hypothetical protein
MNSMRKNLSVLWRHHAGKDMVIWQMMFTGKGALVAQKRNTGERQALFFAIDAQTGKPLMNDFQPIFGSSGLPAGEGWFTGLETTSDTLAYCHAYQQHSPEHIGLWAFDPGAGREVWARPDIVFSANLGNEFLVYRPVVFGGFPERFFMLLNPGSGEMIRELGEDNPEINMLRKGLKPEEERQEILLPEVAGFAGFPALLRGADAEGFSGVPAEYIETGDVTVMAVHEKHGSQEAWSSSLNVWIRDTQVYMDSMQLNERTASRNNFLIRGDKLYYIKEKEELVSVALT